MERDPIITNLENQIKLVQNKLKKAQDKESIDASKLELQAARDLLEKTAESKKASLSFTEIGLLIGLGCYSLPGLFLWTTAGKLLDKKLGTERSAKEMAGKACQNFTNLVTFVTSK